MKGFNPFQKWSVVFLPTLFMSFLSNLVFLIPGLALAALAMPARAVVVSFEFNTTAAGTEGWTASTTPVNALVTGFMQATGIDGISGVITSSDVGVDPQILRSGAGNIISLPAGEKWSTFESRFRHLSGNPGALGTVATAYNSNGTILFFNGSTANLGIGTLTNKSVNGSGAYTGDIYTMTLTADPAGGEWQLLSVSFAAAPVLSGQNFSSVRFDPLGDAAAKNFEIDSIRFTSIPEPGSLVLGCLAGCSVLTRRRR